MNNNLTILQVTAALHQGGVERGTVEMAEFIAAKGARSLVASQGGRMVEQLVNSEHFKLPLQPRTPWHIIYNAVRLAQIIKRKNVSLVHARSRGPAWAAWLACKFTGTPFITTFHGTYGLSSGWPKKFYNRVMVRGGCVIAISEFIKNHIIKNYGIAADNIIVAQRGVDLQQFDLSKISDGERASLRTTYGLAEDAPLILMPGRLTRWKGQQVFIEALGKLKTENWQALVVGAANKKSDYEAELKASAARLGIANKVHFIGYSSNMPLVYASANLCVSASLEPEAFGRVAIEAQSMATPIIATAHGGSLETVLDRKTGWLIPVGDATIMAETIDNALTDPKALKAMGAAGAKHVQQNFSTQTMCENEWNGYNKVLAND